MPRKKAEKVDRFATVPRVEFETFRPVEKWQRDQLEAPAPASFNGFVWFRRYRVTCEPIEEDDETLYQRLLKLWREADNHHQWEPLQAAAKSLGRELLASDWGRDRSPRGS